MKFRTAGERCSLIIRLKTAGTVLACLGHGFNKVDSVAWSSQPKQEDIRQSSGDINSHELMEARSISLESITMLVLFSLERNSTCDPETLQPRPPLCHPRRGQCRHRQTRALASESQARMRSELSSDLLRPFPSTFSTGNRVRGSKWVWLA